MALGLIPVACKVERGPNKGKRVACSLRGGKLVRGRRAKGKSKAGCKKQVVSQYGNRRCMVVCKNKKGQVTSRTAASGCGKL